MRQLVHTPATIGATDFGDVERDSGGRPYWLSSELREFKKSSV